MISRGSHSQRVNESVHYNVQFADGTIAKNYFDHELKDVPYADTFNKGTGTRVDIHSQPDSAELPRAPAIDIDVTVTVRTRAGGICKRYITR